MVFCRGFIYETRFAKGSDKSDPYNMGVFHQPPRRILKNDLPAVHTFDFIE